MQIVFYGSVPSKKNSRRWIKRGNRNYSVPSAAYEAWEKCEVARLKALFHSPKFDHYSLEVTPYLPDNRVRDTDNVLTSIQDCLKASGIIKDDKWQFMTVPPKVNQPIIDRLNPRIEVTVTQHWAGATANLSSREKPKTHNGIAID